MIGLWNAHAQAYLLVLMGLAFTFQVLLAVASLMVIVHVWGAVQRAGGWRSDR